MQSMKLISIVAAMLLSGAAFAMQNSEQANRGLTVATTEAAAAPAGEAAAVPADDKKAKDKKDKENKEESKSAS